MPPRRPGFRLISVLTLAAQLLGLLHLVVEDHTWTAAGQVVDQLRLEGDEHQLAGAHLCATQAVVAPEPDQGCAVATSWTTSGLLGSASAPEAAPPGDTPGLAGAQRSRLDEDVLARAPKGSPPAA